MSFDLKNEKYLLKNDKKWSCKFISSNLKNEKCHLKNDKKWLCIAGLSQSDSNCSSLFMTQDISEVYFLPNNKLVSSAKW